MGNSDGSDMTRLARNPPFNVLVSTLHPKVRQVYWHCSFVFRLYDSCQDSRYQLNAYVKTMPDFRSFGGQLQTRVGRPTGALTHCGLKVMPTKHVDATHCLA